MRIENNIRAWREQLRANANVPQTAEDDVKCFVDGCFIRHPYQASTKHQVALHEAGHFIAFEVEGMIAGMAEIHGSSFGRNGWGGEAKERNQPLYRQSRKYWHPPRLNELMSDARVVLAGPLAEFLLGRGDFCKSMSEIIEAHFLADRAAEMLGRDRCRVLDDIVAGTAAIINTHRDGIEKTAKLLMSLKRIYRNKCLEKALARAKETPVNRLPRAPQSDIDELVWLMKAAVPGIHGLIMQVTTGRAGQ